MAFVLIINTKTPSWPKTVIHQIFRGTKGGNVGGTGTISMQSMQVRYHFFVYFTFYFVNLFVVTDNMNKCLSEIRFQVTLKENY